LGGLGSPSDTFWRAFATFLKVNGEDTKVVQELLRHGSSRVTLDLYSQSLMPAKRAAQQKVVEMVRANSLPSSRGSAISASCSH
jgi:site-specific recombinase XerD